MPKKKKRRKKVYRIDYRCIKVNISPLQFVDVHKIYMNVSNVLSPSLFACTSTVAKQCNSIIMVKNY